MTSIPIDVRRAPYKPKYLTEETFLLNRWFVFGTFPDGTVGVTDGKEDVMDYVPKEKADRIVAARDAFCAVIEKELGQ